MRIVKVNNRTSVLLSLNNVTEIIEMQFSESITILLTVLIILLILVTVLGNSLVIVAFFVDERLRMQSNFLLLNLAICDFFIGAISIPMYIPYVITGKWILGIVPCKLWLLFGYTMSTASAFNVVLISYDRFLSVTKAVIYRSQQRNHTQTVLKMSAVWLLSFLLYGPAILFWEIIFAEKNIPNNICEPGFYNTWYFLLGSSTLDFVLPLISISIFNISIYWNIKRRNRKKRQSSGLHISKEKEKDFKLYIIATNILLSPTHCEFTGSCRSNIRRNNKTSLRECFANNKNVSSLKNSSKPNKIDNTNKLCRDKKVAKSLAILVCIFAICWSPYSFLMFIRAICIDYHIDTIWYDITYWCLWINSAINPVIYPLCHKSFKKAFIKVFAHMCLKLLSK